jgi:uncharacterized protein YdhG (YjbR/CyaY superfamily)
LAKSDFNSIDEYIDSFPKEVQEKLEKIREIVQKTAPKAEETISYGMPTFNLNGSYLIYFAGWKNHISLYPVPSNDEAFQEELSPYLCGKGTAKFPLKKPIPYELVEKIVQYRMKL